MKNFLFTSLAISALAVSVSAVTYTVDFDDLPHGRIVNSQYAGLGLTVSAYNNHRTFHRAVVFDSHATSNINGDTDLLFNGQWAGGNAKDTDLGSLLIIQERRGTTNGGLDASRPDDEGKRPAGYLSFKFDSLINSFGFHFVDIETQTLEGSNVELLLAGSSVSSINFSTFTGVVFGDRYANRVAPIALAQYGAVDEVRINLGGSGAVGDITWSVPDSGTTLALLGAGLIGLLGFRARKN